jgi:hypothetical protein
MVANRQNPAYEVHENSRPRVAGAFSDVSDAHLPVFCSITSKLMPDSGTLHRNAVA